MTRAASRAAAAWASANSYVARAVLRAAAVVAWLREDWNVCWATWTAFLKDSLMAWRSCLYWARVRWWYFASVVVVVDEVVTGNVETGPEPEPLA